MSRKTVDQADQISWSAGCQRDARDDMKDSHWFQALLQDAGVDRKRFLGRVRPGKAGGALEAFLAQ